MFGWPSVRHMRRGLPKTELRRLWDFYQDYGIWQGWLKPKEPGDGDPAHPADSLNDWEADSFVGELNR